MDTFKKFFQDYNRTSGTRRFVNGPRHRGTGFTDTDRYYRRKKQNLVADIYKTDNTKNAKIELLKKNGGTVILNVADLDYIKKTFNVDADGDPKRLGNTGIVLCRDHQTGNFILRK